MPSVTINSLTDKLDGHVNITFTLSRIAAYMPSWMLVLWDKYGWIIKKKKYSFLLLAIAIFESVRVHYTVFLFYLPWLVVFFLYGYWRIFGKISFVRLILMAVSMTPWLLLVGFTLVKSFAPLLLGGPINFSSYGEERLLVDYLSVPPEYFAEGKRNPTETTYADPVCSLEELLLSRNEVGDYAECKPVKGDSPTCLYYVYIHCGSLKIRKEVYNHPEFTDYIDGVLNDPCAYLEPIYAVRGEQGFSTHWSLNCSGKYDGFLTAFVVLHLVDEEENTIEKIKYLRKPLDLSAIFIR